MSQPKGSVSRVSNLVYTRRGGLKTCDGSVIFSAWGGVTPLQWNPTTSKMWRELTYFAPSSGLRTGYYGLYSDPTVPIGGGSTPGGPALTGTASSNGLTGTFYVQVTAVDGVGGETPAGGSDVITLAGQAMQLSWNKVLGSYGYNIYIGTSPGNETLWLPAGSVTTAAGVSVVGRDNTTATVDATWVQNTGQGVPAGTTNTTGSLIFTNIPPGGYSAADVIYDFPPAVSVISTGSAALTATTTDVQGPPVTETIQLRPTSSVQGGPSGGTPNDFANPQFAQDGNPNTAASANLPPGGNQGAQRTWTGWSAPSSTPTALTVNVTSSMSVSNSAVPCFVLISFSLNAGATWQTVAKHSTPGGYATITDAVSIPTSQDLTQLRVSITAAVPSPSATGVANIWEIWVAATTQVPGGSTGGGATTISTAATPNGGLEDVCGPLPQIVSFRGKMILALGNGVPPYESDGSAAGTVPISNDFTAVYPAWAPTTNYNQGDQIEAPSGGLLYVFTAVQGGTSAAGGGPTWPAGLAQTVTDNNIIWKNSGQVSTSPAPPGAAHAEIYAGSLWFANTWPTMTADQLDGPSALRMSILNDPNGWNPLNAAQIAPDDGDECQGIKAFTIAEAGIAPQNFLVYFKYFSTYLIQGVFGAANFAITRLQTDMGCVASRTIQFVPGYGIMRFSHLGFALTDGLNDKLQDPEAIRPYLFAESTEDDIQQLDWSQVWFSKSAQTVDPPMYVAAMPLVGADAYLIGLLTGTTVTVMSPGGGGGGGGTGPPPAVFTFTPSSIAFGNVPAVLTEVGFQMTFTGSGTGVSINSVSLSNGYFSLIQLPQLPHAFTGTGDSVSWYVGLDQSLGNYSAVMTISTSVGDYTINVSGTVVSGSITTSPTQLTFPPTPLGTPSAPLPFTVNNFEPVAVILTGAAFSNPDYAFSPAVSFPVTIQPGASVTYNVVATPTTADADPGNVILTTSLTGINLVVNFQIAAGGTFAFSPNPLNFGNVPGAVASQMAITMTFTGTGPEQMTGLSLSTGYFSIAQPPLLPHTFNNNNDTLSWYVGIDQTPGGYSGNMIVTTTVGSYTILLTANVVGGNLVVSPTTLTFPLTALGSTSAPLSISVTNNEQVPVTLSGFTFSNVAYNFSPQPPFPMTLQPGQIVTMSITITPTTAGANSAVLILLTPLTGVQFVVDLSMSLTRSAPGPRAAPPPPSLPAGDYWVQVGLRGPNGVTSLSPVLGPFNVSSGQWLQVNNAALPPGYYGFRVWFGTSPTALTQFVDGNMTAISVTAPGEGGAPPKGIPDSLTRLFCYDLVLKAWTVIDLPFSISAMKQFRVPNTQPMTALGGSYDTAVRRWQYGDADWDPGAQATQPDLEVRWNFTDAEVHQQSATVRMFHNQVVIRGDGGPPTISVTPQVNGYLQSTLRAAMIALGDGQFEARARIMQTMQNMALSVSGKGPAVIEAIDYQVQPKPAGGALVIS